MELATMILRGEREWRVAWHDSIGFDGEDFAESEKEARHIAAHMIIRTERYSDVRVESRTKTGPWMRAEEKV